MQRPLRAAETGGPAPLMGATGAAVVGFEGIPRRATAAEKVFGIFAWTTEPSARRFRLGAKGLLRVMRAPLVAVARWLVPDAQRVLDASGASAVSRQARVLLFGMD